MLLSPMASPMLSSPSSGFSSSVLLFLLLMVRLEPERENNKQILSKISFSEEPFLFWGFGSILVLVLTPTNDVIRINKL